MSNAGLFEDNSQMEVRQTKLATCKKSPRGLNEGRSV